MTMGDTHDTNWETKVWGFVDLREGSAGSTVTVNGGSYTGSTWRKRQLSLHCIVYGGQ